MPCAALCNHASPTAGAAFPQLSGRSAPRHPAYACVGRVEKAPRNSPDKPVGKSEAPTQTCWSDECAYATRRDEPDELVAGVHDHRAPLGLRPGEAAGYVVRPMQPPRRLPYPTTDPPTAGPEIRWRMTFRPGSGRRDGRPEAVAASQLSRWRTHQVQSPTRASASPAKMAKSKDWKA